MITGRYWLSGAVAIDSWDTSLDVYNKVLNVELALLRENLVALLYNNVIASPAEEEGNYNSIDDFKKLTNLNLAERLTMGEAIDKLRALTHGDFKNAYFVDGATSKKVFVHIKLEVKND